MLTDHQQDDFRRLLAWLSYEGYVQAAAAIRALISENARLELALNASHACSRQLAQELAQARKRCEGLAERVALQSDQLSRNAERLKPAQTSGR